MADQPAVDAPPAEGDVPVEAAAADLPGNVGPDGPAGAETYHLHLRVSRGEGEGGDEVAADAWEFDASSDDEAVMVAVQVLSENFGGQGMGEAAPPEMPVDPTMGAGPAPGELGPEGPPPEAPMV